MELQNIIILPMTMVLRKVKALQDMRLIMTRWEADIAGARRQMVVVAQIAIITEVEEVPMQEILLYGQVLEILILVLQIGF